MNGNLFSVNQIAYFVSGINVASDKPFIINNSFSSPWQCGMHRLLF